MRSETLEIRTIDVVDEILDDVQTLALRTLLTPGEERKLDGRNQKRQELQKLANLLKRFHQNAWIAGYVAAEADNDKTNKKAKTTTAGK